MRTEKDSLGEKEIPDTAYYGIQTARALENFPVSGIREHPAFIRSYVWIKRAAAEANRDLGLLDAARASAILRACDEILGGALQDQFVVDVFQAGAGTSFNMNVNEVVANRALELMGKKRGDYASLHPNDHVNMAQSTNDTFPTAMHLSALLLHRRAQSALERLISSLRRKGEEFAEVIKSGRTHLQDAVPVTLGQEFTAYAGALERSAKFLKAAAAELLELPLGGTAVGTGLNAVPGYRQRAMQYLSSYSGFPLKPTPDMREGMQSRLAIAAMASSLKLLALELTRIANDIRLLASGPLTGLDEIVLPAVQPGSSIMPGKVNPVMAECLNMIAFYVIGSETVIALASQAGQLELNVMMPVMIYSLLQSMEVLANYLPVFAERCIDGIRPNVERCRRYYETSPSLATVLNPVIGYNAAAEVVKQALRESRSIIDVVRERGILGEEELQKLFSRANVTGTGE
ncbi:MAG TPA: aspartate ammonia-lyase [Acidobacteriota bacterium]|jgi:aspartate ammonia-lyase